MDSISIPPLHEAYKALIYRGDRKGSFDINTIKEGVVEECELPVIDVSHLDQDQNKCAMARASTEWGFFQLVRHGIPPQILNRLRLQQEKLFNQPFNMKVKEPNKFSAGSYRWGTPTATSISQLSWSEAFHIPLTDVLLNSSTGLDNLTSTIEQFATMAHSLAQTVADILAEKIGQESTFFQENCLATTCYLRLNRYPPCPVASDLAHGLVPHTDSSFLTIVHQDQVRGLQLVKDGKWISVKPNPDALIVNIGDLFQAWSNGVYKSVEHRVVTNPEMERFSAAYFFCPFDETVIESSREPSVYRKFSYREYRQQVRDDVQNHGTKIGLPNFRIHHHDHEGTACYTCHDS